MNKNKVQDFPRFVLMHRFSSSDNVATKIEYRIEKRAQDEFLGLQVFFRVGELGRIEDTGGGFFATATGLSGEVSRTYERKALPLLTNTQSYFMQINFWHGSSFNFYDFQFVLGAPKAFAAFATTTSEEAYLISPKNIDVEAKN